MDAFSRAGSAFLVEEANMEDQERWKELCAQAAVEKDPVKLIELVDEINRLLDEKEARARANRAKNDYKETDST